MFRNSGVFVVLEITSGDSQAVLPNKVNGFINEIAASEISPVDSGAQVSKMRRQKFDGLFSLLFLFDGTGDSGKAANMTVSYLSEKDPAELQFWRVLGNFTAVVT